MDIKWTNAADEDLEAIALYIGKDKPRAAARQVIKVIDMVEKRLAKAPALGRSGRAPGTREMVVPGTPFVIIYRLERQQLQIIRILHSARQWPAK